jgi:type VI secretion system protein ImpH
VRADAADDGTPGPVLTQLFASAHRFEFFQAVWLLEQMLGAGAPGSHGGPGFGADTGDVFEVAPRRANGRIRLLPRASTVFPAADVHRITRRPNASDSPSRLGSATGETVDVTVTFMGLYGVNAPLPSYFVEQVVRAPDDSEALRGFLDIFNHRIYSLFYRSWKKYRPLLVADRLSRRTAPQSGDSPAPSSPGSAREPLHLRVFRSLAGLGIHRPPAGADDDSAGDPATDPGHLHWAAFAGRLSGHVRNREGLEVILAQTLGVRVRVLENVGRWARIRSRPTMGSRSERPMQVGRGSVVGGRLFDVAGKFRIVLGPLDLATYQSLRPGGEQARLLQSVVALYLTDPLDFDVELQLDPSELAPAALGASHARLGSTARLGRPPDRVVSEVVAY